MANPDIGAMRHRVTLQRATQTHSQSGQLVPGWSSVGTYFCHVEPLRGMELYNARQVKSGIWHKVRMRNVGPVYSTDRFLFESTGRVLNIEEIFRVDERNAYYDIKCVEQNMPTTQL